MNKLLVLSIAAVLVFVALVFIPIPGYYNVKVVTTVSQTCLLACQYAVTSVNPTVNGQATVIDIWGWFGITYTIAPPCINCQYKLVATLFGTGPSSGASASASESKFVSDLVNAGTTDTVTLSIAYVQTGNYGVAIDLYQNGVDVAHGSGNICVGC